MDNHPRFPAIWQAIKSRYWLSVLRELGLGIWVKLS